MIGRSLAASLEPSATRPMRLSSLMEWSRHRQSAWGQCSRPRPDRVSGWVRSRGFRLAIGVCSVGAGIAGCGGGGSSGNGVAAKSPGAIVAAATDAADGAKSVHVSGSVTSGGMLISLNLTLVNGKGAVGQVSETGGVGFRIVALDRTAYINGTDAFLRQFGGAAGVQLFHGRWLKGPIGGQFAGLAQLTDASTLFSMLLSKHGKLAKGATTTVAGQKVIGVNDTTEGGTLYVATSGKPYPIQVSGTSQRSSGRVVFDRYNEPVSLSAPANAIDVTKLSGSNG